MKSMGISDWESGSQHSATTIRAPFHAGHRHGREDAKAHVHDDAKRTFGRAEVEDVAVLAEHVDLLDAGDGLDVELLQRALELFVVLGGRGLRLPDDLAAHGPLAAWGRGCVA